MSNPERMSNTERTSNPERMTNPERRLADPLGKRALFWWPGPPIGPGQTDIDGDPLLAKGPVTVECPSCRVTSRIGIVDFLIFQLPFGVWLPWGRFSHRMTCPACRRRVWASVTVRQPKSDVE